ncbi:MAG TPA: hypothetical protein VF889_00320 [Bacteroidota bacterium]
MGNIFTEGIAKIASNITQSVVSAVLIFLITTYVLVGIGKKEGGGGGADSTKKADAATRETVVPPSGQQGGEMKSPSNQHETPGSAPNQTTSRIIATPSGGSSAGPPHGNVTQGATEPTGGKSTHKGKETTPERSGGKTVTAKEPAGQLPADETAVQQPVLEKTGQETAVRQSKRDTATVEKKASEQAKKVKKHADEVFDELDKETGQNPPP